MYINLSVKVDKNVYGPFMVEVDKRWIWTSHS